MRRAALLTLLLGAWMLITACERAAPVPAPAPSAAQSPRIVALSPAIASILRSTGSGTLLVGRHGFDEWSDQSLPSCGDMGGIDYESLLRVHPTAVLLQKEAAPPPQRLMDLAKAGNFEVRVYPMLSLDELRAAAIDLARRFPAPVGAADRKAEASLTAEMDRAWSRRSGLDQAGTVLMLTATSPKSSALGPGSFHQQILERIGGTPTITGVSRPYIALDAEDVLRLAPGTLVLFVPRAVGAPSRSGMVPSSEYAALLGPLAGLDVPAIHSGRVILIDDPECLLPSLSMVRVAEQLAELLARAAAK